MTQIFATNSQNDIYIGMDGRLAIFNGLPAVLQACEHVAKAQLGEMVLATDLGMPTYQVLWNGSPNPAQYDAALRQAFLSVPDVIEVISLLSSQTKDVFNYTAIIRTTFGSGAISGGIVNG